MECQIEYQVGARCEPNQTCKTRNQNASDLSEQDGHAWTLHLEGTNERPGVRLDRFSSHNPLQRLQVGLHLVAPTVLICRGNQQRPQPHHVITSLSCKSLTVGQNMWFTQNSNRTIQKFWLIGSSMETTFLSLVRCASLAIQNSDNSNIFYLVHFVRIHFEIRTHRKKSKICSLFIDNAQTYA